MCVFIDLDESDALCVCFVCVRSGWDDGSSFRDKWIIHFRGRTSKRNLEWRGMRFQLLMTVWVAPSKNGDDGDDGCYESWHG